MASARLAADGEDIKVFSAGTTDVYGGLLTGNSGSKVIVTGGSTSTFYGAVDMNTGSEFRVSAGSAAVFFGNVTGTSFFTGDGTKYFEDGIHSLKGLPHVIDCRNLGLIGAVELAPRPGAPGERGYETFEKCWDKGVFVRPVGDSVAFCPPLIVQKKHLDQMFGTVAEVLREGS